jgi:hypothetical protein
MSYQLINRPIGFGSDPVTGEENIGISGNFVIEAYQRGYRWTQDEVKKLLDDLSESAREGKKRYSLQPIVVKKLTNGDWELIDGQQRLTTLWLIFNYMQKAGYKRSGAAYSLEYKTRPGSHAYLQTLDAMQAKHNIDYFHLNQAHQAIGQWIDRQGATEQAKEARVNQIYSYLSDSVRVIWYEVPEDEEPIPLFTRLNQGRIPLTDAELIKAVLLTHIAQAKPGRETEVAAQWDGIERDLQRAEIWAFVAPQNSHADQHGTRIDLLLDALANKPATGALRYHTFDALQDKAQKGSLAFWDEVIALHAQILGWFEEPRWYNKIGFLVACGTAISDILRWAQGNYDDAPPPTKSAFENILNTHIRVVLKNTFNDDLDALRYNGGTGDRRLQQVLLLFNVAICRGRFPFEKHAGQAWSLEHIHAQNAQDLNRAEQWGTWLQEHRKALRVILAGNNTVAIEKLLADIDAAIPHLHTRQFGQEEFKVLAGQILLALNNGVVEEADHSIANLALLSHGANAALSNAVFEVKRHKVLEMDRRGDYIPSATRNVFLKYYTPADKLQPHFWSEADKDAYLQTIKNTLATYLQ